MTTTPETPEPFKVWTDDAGQEGFLHGTKADLKAGDLIEAGRPSNYGAWDSAAFVYLTGTLDAATWGAELALGDGPGRIYIVEATGPIEDDPNLTDKRFRAIRRGPSAPRIRSGSSANLWRGRAMRPSRFRR